ncbi:hypothetical protein Cni_G13637 [Canna indica]|uniref:Uncharacterized protein n=1 Tax=Canna indica TaxID=4628 RepID=A0AAQ3KA91_9LILI|nr:hypothetical protein Cni_G13637 [Canna indica]
MGTSQGRLLPRRFLPRSRQNKRFESSQIAQRYAVQQAFKTMMDQAAPQGGQFNNLVFTPPFPFPPPPPTKPQPASPSSSTRFSSQQAVMVDVAATKVETTSPSEVGEETQKSQIEEAEPKKFELLQNERSYVKESAKASPVDTESVKEIPPNGTLNKDGSASSEQSQSGQAPTILSSHTFITICVDLVFIHLCCDYLSEEMRNPDTFKWMMQNPQFRQQMQDMLNNMGGNNEWDNRLTESLKIFNLSSPEVKQQFGKSNIVSSLIVMSIAEENAILKHTIFLK